MDTGLLVTIGVFVLAGIFGLILLDDTKRASKAPKTEKADAATATTTVPISEVERKSEPESWTKSAERFRSSATDS